MTKETLEEAAKLYADNGDWDINEEDEFIIRREAFINAAKSDAARDYWYAKWKEERSYSEEEVKFQTNKLLNDLFFYQGLSTNLIDGIVNKWFKQFKKKK